MARRICEAVKRQREIAGVSQRQLADMLGVSQPTIHNWEHDTEPSLDQLAAIEEALGMRAGGLVRAAGYVDEAPPSAEQAIMADRTLAAADRRALLDVLSLYRGRERRGGR